MIILLLTILSIRPVKSYEILFSDDFNDGVADGWVEKAVRCFDHSMWQSIPSTWIVLDGQYLCEFLQDPYGAFDTGVSTVYDLNLTDYVAEAKVRFKEVERTDFNFRAGIVFRYIDLKHYYSFEISDEYNCVLFVKYAEDDPAYGVSSKEIDYPIFPNVCYILTIVVSGSSFTGYLNYTELIQWQDSDYTLGGVGLRARASDVFFDDFIVSDEIIPEFSTVGFLMIAVVITALVVILVRKVQQLTKIQ